MINIKQDIDTVIECDPSGLFALRDLLDWLLFIIEDMGTNDKGQFPVTIAKTQTIYDFNGDKHNLTIKVNEGRNVITDE